MQVAGLLDEFLSAVLECVRVGGNSLLYTTTDAKVASVAMVNAINRCNFKASLFHLLMNRPPSCFMVLFKLLVLFRPIRQTSVEGKIEGLIVCPM